MKLLWFGGFDIITLFFSDALERTNTMKTPDHDNNNAYWQMKTWNKAHVGVLYVIEGTKDFQVRSGYQTCVIGKVFTCLSSECRFSKALRKLAPKLVYFVLRKELQFFSK